MRAELILTVLLSSAAGSSVSAAAADPAEGLARCFVEAVNATEGAKRRASVTRLFSPATLESVGLEKLVSQVESVRQRFGAIELHHGEIVTFGEGAGRRSSLHVFARASRDAQWQDFQFRLDDATPPRVTQLVFVAQVSEPVALPNGDLTSADTLRWLGAYVDRLASRDSFSGAILVASGDKVIFERAVGVSDADATKKIDATTRFNMASGGKMFTAVAVAKIVEAGKLSWNTPLLQAVDGFPDSPRARAVTLHHLLTHTSGIGEYWTAEFAKVRSRISSTRELLPWVLRAGFDADPGTVVAYSNSNFVLAGLAIEKAAGAPFDAFVKKAIFEPLGMNDTGYPLESDPGLAAPLVRNGGGWIVAPHGQRGTAAGGSYSTPRDLLLFVRGLLSGKLVRPATVELLTTSKTSDFRDGFDYGYGFQVHRYRDTTSFGHGGTTQGVDFALEYFPRGDITLIIFGNRGAPAFDTLRKNVVHLVAGER